MAIRSHVLLRLGFEALPPSSAHPLAGLGFAPAMVTIGAPVAGRMAVQPTTDPAVNQHLATAAMPGYTAQLTEVVSQVPGAVLHATRAAKKPARLKEKIVAEGQPPETVSDYGAAQIAVDSPRARDAVVAGVAATFPVLQRRDRFAAGDPEYHYRSDTLQLQMPNRSSEELQVVPREVMAVNRQEHHAYKEARDAVVAGGSSDKARDKAQAMNDEAMERFTVRNREQAEAVAKSGVVKGAVVKGARVRLADGSVARVLYVDPGQRIVRVRTAEGKNVTVRRKDLQ